MFTKCCYCCCPSPGQSVSRIVGRLLGFWPKTVEMLNIIVGDLPFSGRGDFYITVESGSNPRQSTAVVRGGFPKVVHFRDRIIINVRDSLLEPRVVFHVWELNIAGSEKLCSVELSAKSIIQYAEEAALMMSREERITGPKRFALNSNSSILETAGVPWMSVNFLDVGIAPGYLDDIEYSPSTLTTHKIRLPGYLKDEEEVAAGGFSCVSCASSRAHVRTTMQMPGTYQSGGEALDMQEFKERVSLLDRDGAPMGMEVEPSEIDLSSIQYCRGMLICILRSHTILCVVGIMVYVFWRTRVWSCYRQFRRIAAAELLRDQLNLGATWQGTVNLTIPKQPMTTRDLRLFWEQCQESIDGLDQKKLRKEEPADIRSLCAPTPDEVNQHCNPDEGDMSVRAFRDFAEELEQYDQWVGLQTLSGMLKGGVRCYPSVCQERNNFWVPIGDPLSPVFVIGSFLSICCCRAYFSHCIHRRKMASGEARLEEQTAHRRLA